MLRLITNLIITNHKRQCDSSATAPRGANDPVVGQLLNAQYYRGILVAS